VISNFFRVNTIPVSAGPHEGQIEIEEDVLIGVFQSIIYILIRSDIVASVFLTFDYVNTIRHCTKKACHFFKMTSHYF